MRRLKRPELVAEAKRRNREQHAALALEIRSSRQKRWLTQRGLGERVGLSQSALSKIERGLGGSFSLDTWQRLGLALDRPLQLELRRDPRADPADAGHLAIQELVLRAAAAAGWRVMPELPTRPGTSWRSGDVVIRSEVLRSLVLVECVNVLGDVGAAARSFDRKLTDLEEMGVALGHGQPYRTAGCWVIRASRSNRELLTRYPSLFSARFPGSSLAWLRTLAAGKPPPQGPGLLWSDVGARRLVTWRRG
jgi:transcriptional regulator with XRE-family HTH domain